MNCPNGHGVMPIKKTDKHITFRGVALTIPVEQHVCKVCGLEAGSADQTADIQQTISDCYRKRAGLLTGQEIREQRRKIKLTQSGLAKLLDVGIASIKRWETGLVQSKSMNSALRMAFKNKMSTDDCTGNRTFSIPRIRLVLEAFEAALKKDLLIEGDKMLYSAKYLWYADMISYRNTGRSMTGATYAALPLGPQLNNYKDLIKDIMHANTKTEEPLAKEELAIISSIAETFPKKKDIYDAAHREVIWKRRAKGEMIPYSDAIELTEI
jgi:putative zinc finger/helix-turn-helix YgiT family protein